MTQLALVIDLNVCVGCHACVTSCKEWNTSGSAGYMSDMNPFSKDPTGTFFNRVQTFEVGQYPNTETVHFPKSCLHCEDPPCVPVCPTGASYKRESDGIVLVDSEKCIGCNYCSWACPYGARELDAEQKIMKKCTLCIDRITDETIPEAQRKPACVLACPSEARHMLLIGHNPGMEQVAGLLAGQRFAQRMPTAALVSFVVSADEWTYLHPSQCTRTHLMVPKQLG